MDKFIDLSKVSIETNSPLWQIKELGDEQIIQVTGNAEQDHIHFTSLKGVPVYMWERQRTPPTEEF